MKTQRIRTITFLITMLMLVSVAGCSGKLQAQWNSLSNDEKSRIIINGFQDQLNSLFDTGKSFIEANPIHKDVWQKKAVPAFDLANNGIAKAIRLSLMGSYTPATAYKELQPLIDDVKNVLIAFEAIK